MDMAEPVSGILTIVTVSLAVLAETYKYIKEINLVNDLIKDLLTKLKSLHRLIIVVESTYRQAHLGEGSRPAFFVGRTLEACQKRLSKVKPLVFALAAQESESFLQKMALKRKSDGVKKEIERTIKDMHCDMEYIRTGISCWSLDVASANRRISEAMAAQRASSICADQQFSPHPQLSPPSPTMSSTDTIVDHNPFTQNPRMSIATTTSCPSVSSSSSRALQTQSEDSGSIVSIHSPTSDISRSDWTDFHYAMVKSPVEDICLVLQRHPRPSALANSTDHLQRTPLHLAARYGDVERAHILLEFGADINAEDSEPASVLDLAIAHKHRDFVALLLDHGVSETKILDHNKDKLREMKRTIDLKKKLKNNAPKKEVRKNSSGTGQARWI
ncbi:hypothetical protein BDW02DRAFT_204203 [Decorospora gaudefroyi]|uniref:Uncharacterized protein n=1 Tax=Decorospora gaudefroyi TaxID=184978 RepID=A0A6A5K5S7_9PLEO|nr:hypothetical protein BDW02DRAFT_204203 [Decorospora gaudefroyi]